MHHDRCRVSVEDRRIQNEDSLDIVTGNTSYGTTSNTSTPQIAFIHGRLALCWPFKSCTVQQQHPMASQTF
jgi:hypothetical protein